jgi:hypothetical protein
MKKATTVGSLCLGALAILAMGCGKSKQLQAAETYEQEACACKDAQCAAAATQKFTEATGGIGVGNRMLTESGTADTQAVTKAMTNANACVMKVSMAGVPGMGGGAAPAVPTMPKQ